MRAALAAALVSLAAAGVGCGVDEYLTCGAKCADGGANDATVDDSGTDAGADAQSCRGDGGFCQQNGDCCSNACSQFGRCSASCVAQSGSCSSNDCCVGSFCSDGGSCVACYANNATCGNDNECCSGNCSTSFDGGGSHCTSGGGN